MRVTVTGTLRVWGGKCQQFVSSVLAFRTTFGDNDKDAEELITAGRVEDGLIPI